MAAMGHHNGDGADDEQRNETRTPVTLLVEYEGADELVCDYTENLSSGGVFVSTTRDLEVGTKVRLVLSFPGLLQPIAVSGEVKWSRGREAGAGVGIEFDDGDAKSKLGVFVSQIRAGDPSIVTKLVRVLVVEDNPHVSQLIRDGLSGSGRRDFGDSLAFNFRSANNGKDGLTLLRNERFDALIIDIYLPILDGPAVISQVRADPALAALPIIAVSAGGTHAREAALNAGASVFLDKPMRLRQIIENLRTLLSI